MRLDARLLCPGTSSGRRIREEAHPGGAHRSAVPGDLRRSRGGTAAPERRMPAGSPPDQGERRGVGGGRDAPEQGGDRAHAGGALPPDRVAAVGGGDSLVSRHATVPGDRCSDEGWTNAGVSARAGAGDRATAVPHRVDRLRSGDAASVDEQKRPRRSGIRAGAPGTPDPGRRSRGRGGDGVPAAGRDAGATEIRGDEAPGKDARAHDVTRSHSRGGQARGVAARSRRVHVRERGWTRLRLPSPARVRPCGAGRARRRGHGRQPAVALPCAQSVHGRAGIWRRVHAAEAGCGRRATSARRSGPRRHAVAQAARDARSSSATSGGAVRRSAARCAARGARQVRAPEAAPASPITAEGTRDSTRTPDRHAFEARLGSVPPYAPGRSASSPSGSSPSPGFLNPCRSMRE